MTTTPLNPPTTPTTTPTQAQWDAANKFLGELLVNSTLSQGYLNICQQANGQDNAPEILNNWLSSQGYDTTPELVYAALIALQNTSLVYWSGIYGQSFFQDTLGKTSVAPVLQIIPDAEGNAIPSLNGVALQNFTFKSVITNNISNPTLTWGLDSNSTAGNIIFYYTSAVNANPEPPTGYTGNWFKGTLQTASNTSSQSYFGGLTNPNNLQQNAVSPGDATQQSPNFISTYKYWFIGGGVTVTVAALGVLAFRYKLGRWPFQNTEEQEQTKRQLFDNPSDSDNFQDAINKVKIQLNKVQNGSPELSVILEVDEADEDDQPSPPEALNSITQSNELNEPNSAPLQEDPLQQQQKIEGEQPQANPDPSAQQPVQSSQQNQIKNASANLGDETSPAPVQQSPSEGEQTSPDTEEKSQFPEEEEGE